MVLVWLHGFGMGTETLECAHHQNPIVGHDSAEGCGRCAFLISEVDLYCLTQLASGWVHTEIANMNFYWAMQRQMLQ
jgi:hypothetical protein